MDDVARRSAEIGGTCSRKRPLVGRDHTRGHGEGLLGLLDPEARLRPRAPAAHLLFKGGTSLSKVYGIIERFSEDIDLSLSREDLGFGGDRDPYNAPSRKKQKSSSRSSSLRCTEAIATELLPRLRERFASVLGPEGLAWSLAIDA